MSTRTDSFFQRVGKTFPLLGEYPAPYYFRMSKDAPFRNSMADKIHTGEIYFSNGEAMIVCQNQCLEPLCDFTKTHPSEMEKR